VAKSAVGGALGTRLTSAAAPLTATATKSVYIHEREMDMTLDFIGGVLLTAAIVVNLIIFVGALAVSNKAKLILGILMGLWVGLQASLAAAGVFASPMTATVPLIGIMMALPLVAVALAAWRSSSVRRALLALPTPLLIGLNFGRVFGLFFLLLAANGRLGGPFPQFAGWGDVITGLAAVPLAYLAAQGALSRGLAAGWNYFGAADLLLAVTLGTVSTGGFVLQLIEAGTGSAAIVHLPWSLIPTVLVPFYLILHGIIFAQLRAGSVAVEGAPGKAAAA
jgi:hypothetical protein